MPNDSILSICILGWLVIGFWISIFWLIHRSYIVESCPYLIGLSMLGPMAGLLFLINN
jgi:hypothetical protein